MKEDKMEEQFGVMVCGHGSRDEDAVSEFQAVAHGIKERLPQYETDWGFLEFATPVIRNGLDALRDKGIARNDSSGEMGRSFCEVLSKN